MSSLPATQIQRVKYADEIVTKDGPVSGDKVTADIATLSGKVDALERKYPSSSFELTAEQYETLISTGTLSVTLEDEDTYEALYNSFIVYLSDGTDDVIVMRKSYVADDGGITFEAFVTDYNNALCKLTFTIMPYDVPTDPITFSCEPMSTASGVEVVELSNTTGILTDEQYTKIVNGALIYYNNTYYHRYISGSVEIVYRSIWCYSQSSTSQYREYTLYNDFCQITISSKEYSFSRSSVKLPKARQFSMTFTNNTSLIIECIYMTENGEVISSMLPANNAITIPGVLVYFKDDVTISHGGNAVEIVKNKLYKMTASNEFIITEGHAPYTTLYKHAIVADTSYVDVISYDGTAITSYNLFSQNVTNIKILKGFFRYQGSLKLIKDILFSGSSVTLTDFDNNTMQITASVSSFTDTVTPL